jgi:hypothetical protein
VNAAREAFFVRCCLVRTVHQREPQRVIGKKQLLKMRNAAQCIVSLRTPQIAAAVSIALVGERAPLILGSAFPFGQRTASTQKTTVLINEAKVRVIQTGSDGAQSKPSIT